MKIIKFPSKMGYLVANGLYKATGIKVMTDNRNGNIMLIPYPSRKTYTSHFNFSIPREAIPEFIAALIPPEETIYVLFGQDAVSVFETDGLKGLVKAMRKNDVCTYDLREFSANARPEEILYATDGWNGYVFLTKKEYKKLQSL